jgi:hypothetical protein
MNHRNLYENYWLTDGGLETTIIYHFNIDLPHFAAFELLNKPHYQLLLQAYYRQYMNLAKRFCTGFILESPTWRANLDWGYKMGYSACELIDVNELAVRQLHKLRSDYQNELSDILISGCIGPVLTDTWWWILCGSGKRRSIIPYRSMPLSRRGQM